MLCTHTRTREHKNNCHKFSYILTHHSSFTSHLHFLSLSLSDAFRSEGDNEILFPDSLFVFLERMMAQWVKTLPQTQWDSGVVCSEYFNTHFSCWLSMILSEYHSVLHCACMRERVEREKVSVWMIVMIFWLYPRAPLCVARPVCKGI